MTEEERLKKYWLWLVGKKEYSAKELLTKAFDKGYSKDLAEDLLEKFKKFSWQNDERLAEILVNNYINSKGKLWIQRKLQQRGISQETIQKVFEDTPTVQDIRVIIKKIRNKYKFNKFSECDYKLKQKIFGYLSRNGFTNISEILAKLDDKN